MRIIRCLSSGKGMPAPVCLSMGSGDLPAKIAPHTAGVGNAAIGRPTSMLPNQPRSDSHDPHNNPRKNAPTFSAIIPWARAFG